MRGLVRLLACVSAFAIVTGVWAQTPDAASQAKPAAKPEPGPADPKARKTYDEALKLMKEHRSTFALDGFRKADKQDGGSCVPCEYHAWQAAVDAGDLKTAREQAEALLAHVTSSADKATAQYLLGQAWLADGVQGKHDKSFEPAEAAFKAAILLRPNRADYLFADATALAHLKQDDAARARFQEFLKIASKDDLDYARAQRFVERPELARARVAPNFRIRTQDGKVVTLESLTGKVVLIDFWATWCGPCSEALPHIQKIAHQFDGQPLVVLSVSLDKDEAKWKDFMAKNKMTWLQYRDGGFDGVLSNLFEVSAIPATFTIDADGVLEDQHVGDANVEGKLKKMLAQAVAAANRKPAS